MNKKELVQGMRDSIPIVLGYFPLGFAFGVLAVQVGLSIFQSVLMSVLCFTGAGQYISIGVMQAGGAVITAILANILVNLRYFLFATSMVPHYKDLPTVPASILSYGLTDETYAVAISRYQTRPATIAYMAGLNLTSHIAWITSTFIGAALGMLITNTDQYGFGFALPAMYTCLLVFMINKRSDIIAALSAALTCLVIGWLIPASMANMSNIIIATILGATIGVIIHERD
ncbi:MAG: AzlC family ABC transporter permease [Syntrophomonadaceae bacterium]|nr:AzlC family ABC transporter permease [Syntrophomonadaceae bacterium]